MNRSPIAVKLSTNTFYRKYNEIGYLYHQKTKLDVVLNEVASIFVSNITREFISIKNIIQSIILQFKDADIAEIEQDFIELIIDLSKDDFVVISYSLTDSCELDNTLSTTSTVFNHNDYIPSSVFLQDYFCKHPTIFSMQIELTSLCNLKCIHCYHGDNHPKLGMSTEKILNLLDQLKELNTLKVVFTGGEAFLHPDLPEILNHARHDDFSISLLSNGTKLTDRLLKSLIDNNIGVVQISLYSLDAAIHDYITQKKGSFNRTMHNINRLLESKIPLIIACPVMKPNLKSLEGLIIWGQKNKIQVNPDVVIKARSNFNNDNLNHRLDKEEIKTAIKIITEFSPTYQKSLLSNNINKRKLDPNDPICGIGTTSLCISYDGFFYPCPGMKYNIGDFNTNSVSEIWSDSPQLKELRKLKLSSYSKCVQCTSIDYCVLCPAKFYNESKGNYLTVTSHFCSVASTNKQIAEEYVRNHMA